jgi:thiol-activated cytolysin
MMTSTRKSTLPRGLLAALLVLGCNNDSTAPLPDPAPAIDQGIRALVHLDQIEPFAQRPAGDPVTNTYDVDGRTYECTEQQFEVAAKFDENIALNPTSDILWPGAIVDGASLKDGTYIPILANRAPLTISVSLHNLDEVSATVADPKLSTMREALADLLTQEVPGATEARVTFEITDVYSESQLDIALGVTYNSGLASVRNQFDFSNTEILSRTVVKFLQVYYTVDIDLPQRPSELFAPSVTWASLDGQIPSNVAPTYISTISFGRMALFTVESTYSSTQVHEALEASFAAFNTSTSLDVKHAQVLAQSSIKAMIIGGSGAQAVLAVNGFDGLKEYMTTGGNYNKDTAAAPLAYKLRYLSDNAAAEVVKAQSYVVRTCNELRAGRYGMKNDGGYVARLHVYYLLDGQSLHWSSGDITIGLRRAVDIPAKATNVWVRGEEMWGFGWTDIFRYPGSGTTPRPEVKCWRVWGTTLSPKYGEITCDF